MGYELTYRKKVSLTSSEILSLNSTPQDLISAPDSDQYIEILSASVQVRFNSSAYATNTNLRLSTNNAGTVQFSNSSILTATADKIEMMNRTSDSELIKGNKVIVDVGSGDPTGGDSPIDIFVTYAIITDA